MLDLPGAPPGHLADLALHAHTWPGSGQAADLMLIGAAYGAAHIIFRKDSLSAARTNPPASVQFVALQFNVRAQEMLFGFPRVVSCLDAGQWNVSIGGRINHRGVVSSGIAGWLLTAVTMVAPHSCVPTLQDEEFLATGHNSSPITG